MTADPTRDMAEVLNAADDRWQHGIGSGGYDMADSLAYFTMLAEALTAAGYGSIREAEKRAEVRALREAADDMDDTDDPDAIHVDNGEIDLWLSARADRIAASINEEGSDQ